MSEKEVNNFISKLNFGLKLAEKRMLEEKASRDESVIIYTEKGGIQHIPAKKIIADNNLLIK